MSTPLPFIRQFAWISLLPHIALMSLFLFLFYYLIPSDKFVMYALFSYFLLSFGSRYFVLGDQRKGMTLLRNYYFEAALLYFQRSVEFFTRNAWLDRYRYLLLLSTSRMGLREMGLCNLAYCYSQLDEMQQAKTLYQKILAEYPENGIAISALESIQEIEKGLGN